MATRYVLAEVIAGPTLVVALDVADGAEAAAAKIAAAAGRSLVDEQGIPRAWKLFLPNKAGGFAPCAPNASLAPTAELYKDKPPGEGFAGPGEHDGLAYAFRVRLFVPTPPKPVAKKAEPEPIRDEDALDLTDLESDASDAETIRRVTADPKRKKKRRPEAAAGTPGPATPTAPAPPPPPPAVRPATTPEMLPPSAVALQALWQSAGASSEAATASTDAEPRDRLAGVPALSAPPPEPGAKPLTAPTQLLKTLDDDLDGLDAEVAARPSLRTEARPALAPRAEPAPEPTPDRSDMRAEKPEARRAEQPPPPPSDAKPDRHSVGKPAAAESEAAPRPDAGADKSTKKMPSVDPKSGKHDGKSPDAKSGRHDAKSGRQDAKSGRQDAKSGRHDAKSGRNDARSGRNDARSGRHDPKSGREDMPPRSPPEKSGSPGLSIALVLLVLVVAGLAWALLRGDGGTAPSVSPAPTPTPAPALPGGGGAATPSPLPAPLELAAYPAGEGGDGDIVSKLVAGWAALSVRENADLADETRRDNLGKLAIAAEKACLGGQRFDACDAYSHAAYVSYLACGQGGCPSADAPTWLARAIDGADRAVRNVGALTSPASKADAAKRLRARAVRLGAADLDLLAQKSPAVHAIALKACSEALKSTPECANVH